MTWATSVPILVFLGLSVLDLRPTYATERRQRDVRQHHRLMPPPIRGGGIIIPVRYCQSIDQISFAVTMQMPDFFNTHAILWTFLNLRQRGNPATLAMFNSNILRLSRGMCSAECHSRVQPPAGDGVWAHLEA